MLKHKYIQNIETNFIGHNLPKISLAKKQKTLKKKNFLFWHWSSQWKQNKNDFETSFT